MKLQHAHYKTMSLKLWLEHRVQQDGQAYFTTSGNFYPIQSEYSNYYTYALPFQPIIADRSVTGAFILSGVVLSGVFVPTGNSGFVDFNYEKGHAYFSHEITDATTKLSGTYSVAEFNTKLTAFPEETLLFETKHQFRDTTTITESGIPFDETTFPIIYIRPFGRMAEDFAMGGLRKQTDTYRLLVLGDSQFQVDGVESIMRDQERRLIPLFTGTNMLPYNYLGGLTGDYNYTGLTVNMTRQNNSMYLNEVRVTRLPGTAFNSFRDLSSNIFLGIIDLEVETVRVPDC